MSAAFHTDYDRAPWRKMTLQDLTTPKPGRICMGPHWWAVTDDGCVLFYGNSPQCNTDRRVVEHVRKDCTPKLIEMAFVPHRCEA